MENAIEDGRNKRRRSSSHTIDWGRLAKRLDGKTRCERCGVSVARTEGGTSRLQGLVQLY